MATVTPGALHRTAVNRAKVVASDDQTARRLRAAYGDVRASLENRLAILMRQLEARRRSGDGSVPVSWLYDRDRLAALLDDVTRHLDAYADQAREISQAAISAGARAGESAAIDQMAAALPPGVRWSFAHVNPDLLERLTYNAQPGGRTDTRFASFAPDAVGQLKSALLSGVSTGMDMNTLAGLVGKALDTPDWRSLLIARTETLTAYRDASLLTYQRNAAVVEQWQWLAAAGCCPFCAEEDGSLHELDEEMDTHPNCRCAMVPVTRSWDEILADVPDGYAGAEE